MTSVDPVSNEAESPGDSRALVALASSPSRPAPVTGRRSAPFLAHLLAVKDRQPQTCERRRVAPSEAIAAYRGAAALIR